MEHGSASATEGSAVRARRIALERRMAAARLAEEVRLLLRREAPAALDRKPPAPGSAAAPR